MPLVKGTSDKSREKNIKRELKENPDMNPKQAVAIGYSVQREAKKKKDNEKDSPKKKYPMPASRFKRDTGDDY